MTIDHETIQRQLDDEHTLIPAWCRDTLVLLLTDLETAENAAQQLADEAIENEQAMRDEMRDVEYHAKEEGYRAGANGGWY